MRGTLRIRISYLLAATKGLPWARPLVPRTEAMGSDSATVKLLSLNYLLIQFHYPLEGLQEFDPVLGDALHPLLRPQPLSAPWCKHATAQGRKRKIGQPHVDCGHETTKVANPLPCAGASSMAYMQYAIALSEPRGVVTTRGLVQWHCPKGKKTLHKEPAFSQHLYEKFLQIFVGALGNRSNAKI